MSSLKSVIERDTVTIFAYLSSITSWAYTATFLELFRVKIETREMIMVSRIKVPKAKPSLAFTPKDDSAFIVIITYLKFKIHTN